MGQKINPKSFRMGVIELWSSRWLSLKNYKQYLQEDEIIRNIVLPRLKQASVDVVNIERSGESIKVIIRTARPGLVIGRSGKGVEDLRKDVMKALGRFRRKWNFDSAMAVNIDVEEIKRSDISAAVTAQNIATDLERRLRFRRVLKQTMEKVKQNKDVQGVKIRVSGRLDGSEIARAEWMSSGKVPLHTLRSKIDYSQGTAFCPFGAIGIKVWIYKGDVFESREE